MAEKILSPAEFYKQVGKEDREAIVDLSEARKMDFIPTGSWIINSLIGDGTMTDKPGGFPRGHVVEVFGDESSGKSTLLMSAIRQAQLMGEVGVLLDFEQTFHEGYAKRLGVDLDKNKFILSQPKHFEQGARIIKDALAMRPAIICVDSVSAMTPAKVFEGDVDDGVRIGLQAQLMSYFLGYITKFLKDCNTCLLFANQIRARIKTSMYDRGPDETTSGGNALKFYSSLRLKTEKSTVEKVEVISKLTGKKDKEPVNVMVKASVVKNKIDKPFRSAPVYIKFGEGFDNIQSIIELATNIGVIKRSGAMYTFTVAGEDVLKSNGKQQLWNDLNSNERAFGLLQKSLVLKEDEQIKEEYKEEQESPDEMTAMMANVSETFVEKAKERKARKSMKADDKDKD